MDKKYITINSTVLYVISFLITTIIHEFSHALFGMAYNSHPVLHHNFVEHFSTAHLSIIQQVVIAFAGPIASLIQGIFAGILYLKSQKQNLKELFLIWMSILGFNNFFGYLMTAPIFTAGDVGKAYVLLEVPVIFQIIVALIGTAILAFIAYKLTVPFLNFSYNQDWVADRQAKKNFSFQIIIIPWIVGSSIITVMYLPIIAVISIIYPIMSGMVFIFPWQFAQRVDNIELSKDKSIGKLSILSIFLLAVLIAGFRLILAPGIQL